MARPSKTNVRGLFRDKDGRYRIDLRWREPSTGEMRRFGQRLPRGLSGAAAKHRAREILEGAFAGSFDPKRQKPRRLEEALDDYIKWAEVNRPKTAADRLSLTKILKKHLGDPRLDELSPFHVERLKRDRGKDGAAAATTNRAVAMLKHFCGIAASLGWMTEATAKAVRAVKLLREPPGRVRYLTPEEEGRLFQQLSPDLSRIVLTALLSGMRRGEVLERRLV